MTGRGKWKDGILEEMVLSMLTVVCYWDISPVIRSSTCARLCYDTPSVEALPFLSDIPETLPRALPSDVYQETWLSQLLGERVRRNLGLREACIQEKSPLTPLCGFGLCGGSPDATALPSLTITTS